VNMISPIEMYNLKTIDDVDALEGDQAAFTYIYEYYLPEMPYGTAKARDGDPYEWIYQQLEKELA